MRTDLNDISALLEHDHWQLRAPSSQRGRGGEGSPWAPRRVLDGAQHGDGVVALLAGVADRDAAGALRHYDIGLPRSAFGEAGEGEYFWVDLLGLPVTTVDGLALGVVEDMMETGSNDVLVVGGERQRLVPFIAGDVVVSVQLRGVGGSAGIVVDWDPEF